LLTIKGQERDEIPVASTLLIGEEIILNFRQLPFRWDIYLRRGRCAASGRSWEAFFENWLPLRYRLLHFVTVPDRECEAGARKQLTEAFVAPHAYRIQRFEVTILRRMPGLELAPGVSSGGFQVGQRVGWDGKTIDVRSDDGVCHRENTGCPPLFDPQVLHDGRLPRALHCRDRLGFVQILTIDVRRPLVFIANFGE
jgi:hypothetical protein